MTGVRLRGDAARVLRDGRQIGNIYRWRFEGLAGDWEAQAIKYRIEEDATGDIELSFFLGQNEIHAVGQFMGDVLPDGVMHREPVRLKGQEVEFR